MLGVTGVYDTPVQIQGFAADNVFDADPPEIAETHMGIDGRLSAGFIHKEVSMKIHLEADSESTDFFDQWYTASKTNQDVYFAFGNITLVATGKTYNMTRGVLKGPHVIPSAGKTLKAQEYAIVWESVEVAPNA
jgi:hypothetical protein